PLELVRQRGARILLVEDSPLNRQVALELLEEISVDVDVAVNGVEAIQKVQQNFYDLVLMDIQMPEMDGMRATRTLRSDSRYQQLPIIAMTAHAMAGDRELSLAAGMNDHITKPLDPEPLYAALARWLPRRRSSDPAPATQVTLPVLENEAQQAGLGELAPLIAVGIDVNRGLAHYLNRRSFYITV